MNGRVTSEYLENIRFVERNAWFDPSVYSCFLLTGHAGMNAFFYERNLCDGRVNVEKVLECKETYECFCKYALNVFVRR